MPKKLDLTNQKFNKLSPIETEYKRNGAYYWKCLCDCGNYVTVYGPDIKNGHTKSCGCIPNNKPEDLTGQKFGRLVATILNSIRPPKWLCKCDCGNEIIVPAGRLKSGNTKSCGCYMRETASKRMSKQTGKNNHRWRTDLTEEQRAEKRIVRKSIEYKNWRQKVYKRDNYTCQICKNNKHGTLEAHHIYSFHSHEHLRFITSNGVTLCKDCHTKFHKEYGYENNTRKQFNKFKKSKT